MSETELLYKFRIIIIIIIIIIIARASHLVAYKAQQSRYVRWGKYNENTAPIYSKVHDFFVLKNELTWEAPRYPSEPPWRRKEFCVDILVSKKGNKTQNSEIIAAVANEKIDSSRINLDLHIYTDASKTLDGKTSAAF